MRPLLARLYLLTVFTLVPIAAALAQPAAPAGSQAERCLQANYCYPAAKPPTKPTIRRQAAPKASGKTTVVLACGLFMFDKCQFNDLAAKMRRQGWDAQVYSHYVNPYSASAEARARGDFVAYVGHSAGADRVVATEGSKMTFSVDATVANIGARPKTITYAFYNPANRIPLVICCGGAYVNGAKNQVWRQPHVAMAGDPALHTLIIQRIKSRR
jgi:hypothetical protein